MDMESAAEGTNPVAVAVAEPINNLVNKFEINNNNNTIQIIDIRDINNIKPVRVIDGIHDFYNDFKNVCNNALAKQYNLNNFEFSLIQNQNTLAGSYKLIDKAPETLSSLVNLNNNDIRRNNPISLVSNNNSFFDIQNPPVVMDTINYNFFDENQLNNYELDLPIDGNYIINITGEKEGIINDSKGILKKLIIKSNFTQDASKLSRSTINSLLVDNLNNSNSTSSNTDKNGISYLSHLIDPATTKNNKISNNLVNYKLLFTFVNGNTPLYCSISNLPNSNKDSFKMSFSTEISNLDSTNNFFILNTGENNNSPGINSIVSYINNNIPKSSKNKDIFNNYISHIIKTTNTDNNFSFNNVDDIDWTNFFELLINKCISAVGNISNTPELIYNILISFKTIGDQMYYYDALALQTDPIYNVIYGINKPTTVVTSDGFLAKAIILTQTVNVLFSSGSHGNRNIIYYKAPENMISNEEERNRRLAIIEAKKQANMEEIRNLIFNENEGINRLVKQVLFPNIDLIIKNNVKLVRNMEVYDIKISQTYKKFYNLKICDEDNINCINNYVSSSFCTFLFYALWKFYLLYFRLLKLLQKYIYNNNFDINTLTENKDVVNIINVKQTLISFNTLIESFDYNSVDGIKSIILQLLDLDTTNRNIFERIIIQNPTEYNENNMSLIYYEISLNEALNIIKCMKDIKDSLNSLIADVPIPNFSCSTFFLEDTDIKNYGTWSKRGLKLLTDFYTLNIETTEISINSVHLNIGENNINQDEGEEPGEEPAVVPGVVPAVVPGVVPAVVPGEGIVPGEGVVPGEEPAVVPGEGVDEEQGVEDVVVEPGIGVYENNMNQGVGDKRKKEYTESEKVARYKHKGGGRFFLNVNESQEEKTNNYNKLLDDYKYIVDEYIVQLREFEKKNQNEEYVYKCIDLYNINKTIDNLELLYFGNYLNNYNCLISSEVYNEINIKLNTIFKKNYEIKVENNNVNIVKIQNSMLTSDDSNNLIEEENSQYSMLTSDESDFSTNKTHGITGKKTPTSKNTNTPFYDFNSPTTVSSSSAEKKSQLISNTQKLANPVNLLSAFNKMNTKTGGTRKVKRVKKKYLTKRKQDINKKHNKKTKVNKKYKNKNKNKKTRKH